MNAFALSFRRSSSRRLFRTAIESRVGQIALLILFWRAGEGISRVSHLPIPGSIIGLFLVLMLLGTGVVSLQRFRRGAHWFLGEMLLFFVPPVLAVLDHPEFLGVLGLKLLFAIVAGTAVVMTVTAVVIDLCYRIAAPKRILGEGTELTTNGHK